MTRINAHPRPGLRPFGSILAELLYRIAVRALHFHWRRAEDRTLMFLYRRAYYIEREEPQKKPSESNETYAGKLADWHDLVASVKNEAELIVAKNRHGPTDKINLFFEPEFARFRMRSYREEVA